MGGMDREILDLLAEICPDAPAAELVQAYGERAVTDAIRTLQACEPGPMSPGRLRTACADGWNAQRNPSIWLLESAGLVRGATRMKLAAEFPTGHIKAAIDHVAKRFPKLKTENPERFATKVLCAIRDNDAKWSVEVEARKQAALSEAQQRIAVEKAAKLAEAARIVESQASANADREAARAEFAKVEPAILKLALDEVIDATPLVGRGSFNSTRIKSGDVECAASHFLRHKVRERIAAILAKATRYVPEEPNP